MPYALLSIRDFVSPFQANLKCYYPTKAPCPNSPVVKCSLSQSIFISLPQHFSKLQMIFGFYLLPHFFFFLLKQGFMKYLLVVPELPA